MKSRFVSIILIFTLFLSFSNFAFAVEEQPSKMSTNLKEQIIIKTKDVLQVIENQKGMYGLGEVDFSNLYLSKQIPAYELKEKGASLITDVMYFPILDGEKWVATSIVFYDNAGNINVQISKDYAEKYNEAKIKLSNVALLFDNSSAYIFSEKKGIKMLSSTESIDTRVDYEKYCGDLNLTTSPLVAEKALNLKEEDFYPFSLEAQRYLNVPLVQQPAGSESCWAAAVKSICGYHSINVTIDQIYTKSGIEKYEPAPTSTARAVMESYDLNTLYYTSLYWSTLTYLINSDVPIYASASTLGKNLGHAVVISGYYEYTRIDQLGIISYMDPSSGAIQASTVSTDNELYYVDPATSVSYRLLNYVPASLMPF